VRARACRAGRGRSGLNHDAEVSVRDRSRGADHHPIRVDHFLHRREERCCLVAASDVEPLVGVAEGQLLRAPTAMAIGPVMLRVTAMLMRKTTISESTVTDSMSVRAFSSTVAMIFSLLHGLRRLFVDRPRLGLHAVNLILNRRDFTVGFGGGLISPELDVVRDGLKRGPRTRASARMGPDALVHFRRDRLALDAGQLVFKCLMGRGPLAR